MHEDDTLSRFERSQPGSGGIEPLDSFVLVETSGDETEKDSGLIITSRGEGAPSPVSMSALRLIRKVAHFVLQWCMKSTGSFQPWCVNSTTM